MDKKLTVKDKIFAFLEKKGISKTEFYAETGIESSNFKGKNKDSLPGSAMLVKILTKYPDLSADWLLTGEGDMLKTNRITENSTPAKQASDTSKDNTNLRISQKIGEGIPYYDVDFLGGFSEIFNSQSTIPTYNIIVPGFEKATVWCNVTGHSMEPRISHGDIIALRKCSLSDIQYGEIYAVVLDTIRTIKIIRRGSTPDVLRYVPINPSFDEQEFPVSRILHVFEVIGTISKFF